MAGRHVAKTSSERRTALAILAGGAVVALASLFGTLWLVRAGVVLAVVMAVVAVWVSWRELDRERREHREEIRQQLAARTALTEKHHRDSVALIDRFEKRIENLKAVIATLRRQLAASQGELSSMRGNAAWLRGEIAERQARIDALSNRLAELEQAHGDNVVDLPRHATLHPSVADVFGDDEHPTMVDLAKLQLDVSEPQLRRHA